MQPTKCIRFAESLYLKNIVETYQIHCHDDIVNILSTRNEPAWNWYQQ